MTWGGGECRKRSVVHVHKTVTVYSWRDPADEAGHICTGYQALRKNKKNGNEENLLTWRRNFFYHYWKDLNGMMVVLVMNMFDDRIPFILTEEAPTFLPTFCQAKNLSRIFMKGLRISTRRG